MAPPLQRFLKRAAPQILKAMLDRLGAVSAVWSMAYRGLITAAIGSNADRGYRRATIRRARPKDRGQRHGLVVCVRPQRSPFARHGRLSRLSKVIAPAVPSEPRHAADREQRGRLAAVPVGHGRHCRPQSGAVASETATMIGCTGPLSSAQVARWSKVCRAAACRSRAVDQTDRMDVSSSGTTQRRKW